MSYRSYDRSSDRHGDSRRRESGSSSRRGGDSPPRRSDSHRSRRSPSPGPSRPRDPKSLPESFGRPAETKPDDDLSVLQRMRSSYENSPLHILYRYLEKKEKVKIWTRNYKEVRGVMTGFIIAFDKHWNIILSDVDEVYLKFKKNKSPFLRDVTPNENLPDIPAKTPRKKNADKPKDEAPKPPEPKKTDGNEKRRKRTKKPKATSEKRQSKMLFIRGDNIVIISPAVDDDDEEDEEEEGMVEIKSETE